MTNKSVHNTEQKEKINRAWAFVLYWAERKQGLRSTIEEAMKADKRGRTTFETSRALIMRQALRIWEDNPTLQDVRHEDPEIIKGALAAYNALCCAKDWGAPPASTELISLVRAALHAHNQAIESRLQSLEN